MYTKSPSGDPIAFLIRGAVIALRTEDSSSVLMKFIINEVRAMGWKRRRKSKHKQSEEQDIDKESGKIVALAGNPNVGKNYSV